MLHVKHPTRRGGTRVSASLQPQCVSRGTGSSTTRSSAQHCSSPRSSRETPRMFRTSYEEFPLGMVVEQTPMVVAPASAMHDYATVAHPVFRGSSRLSARRALCAPRVSRETGCPARLLPTALSASARIHTRAPHVGKPLLQLTAHPGNAKTPTVGCVSTPPAEADGWRLLHTASPALPRRTHAAAGVMNTLIACEGFRTGSATVRPARHPTPWTSRFT